MVKEIVMNEESWVDAFQKGYAVWFTEKDQADRFENLLNEKGIKYIKRDKPFVIRFFKA